MNHCWKDLGEYLTEVYGFGSIEWASKYQPGWQNGTCMLEDGHDGEHEFTPDDQIGVTFVSQPDEDGHGG